jgi:hypothetical protein
MQISILVTQAAARIHMTEDEVTLTVQLFIAD